MKSALPYPLSGPPERVKKLMLDNIALVPASLLSLKGTYQPIANTLPRGSVLCVPQTQRQQKILAQVASFLREKGHQVITLPIERITRSVRKPQQPDAENLQLAF